jgi:hypothetical protein
MKEPFERLMAGRTLAERYRLEEAIGSGGMSVVFRGRDERLDRPVAVKVVSPAAGTAEARGRLRERFRREAATAARVARHPNVAQVFDYGTDPELDLDFIVMELLRGLDLKAALRDRPPAPDEAVRILRAAAEGIAAGHAEGILHRDVKPANVFLVGGGRGAEEVRVLDFGIAKLLEGDPDDSLTVAGEAPHSPAYASPEQLRPGATLTAASDVYQLGLLGYEMLAGRRPYDDEARRRMHAGEAVPLPETDAWAAAPASARAAVERALQPRPERRYPDAAAFADALAAGEDDHTVLSPAPDVRDDDETRLLEPASARVHRPAPPTSPAPAEGGGAPVAATAPRRLPRLPRAAWLAPIALVAVVGLWVVTRGGTEPAEPPRTATDPSIEDAGELRELDDAFLRLQGEVAELEAEAAAEARGNGAEAADGHRGDARAAAEVQRTIADLTQALVAGDLDRHVAHYADTVEVEGRARRIRDLRRDRERLIGRYPDRRMTIVRQASTLLDEPDRARTLVDREWHFAGSRERWEGADRQDLLLERRGDRWRVVSERRVQLYREERGRI